MNITTHLYALLYVAGSISTPCGRWAGCCDVSCPSHTVHSLRPGRSMLTAASQPLYWAAHLPPTYHIDIVTVCTDFSGRAPHRQVGVNRVISSGSLGGETVSIPGSKWQEAGEGISCSRSNISHFHQLYTYCDNWSCVVVELTLCLEVYCLCM